MHRNIILRFAVGLVALLVVASVGFAWGVSQRERRLPARATDAGATYSETAAAAAYKKRCGKCHALEQTTNWAAQQPAATREIEIFNFLQQHDKAPEEDNRLIARFLAKSASRS